jgi:NAD-dependent dihydropyrimidine dehydrogenase PreA subunit
MNQNLYVEMAVRLHAPKSNILPRLLQILADETDIQILLMLPADIPTLTDKLHLTTEILENRLHELYLKGIVLVSRRTSPPTYRTVKEVIHLHDTSVQWKKAPKEFLDLWQQWVETEFLEMSREMETVLKGSKPPTRIIAANIWVEPRSQVMHFDSIKEIVNNARSLAVLPCTCRIKAKKCNHLLEACIVLNKSADYNIERGTGRKIDSQEALEIFRKCEEEGLVHLTGANSQDDPGPLLCNCCPCCCMGLSLIMKGLTSFHDPSRFRADIDKVECNGCGSCHGRCNFGAIGWEDGEGSTAVIHAEKCMGCGLCQSQCSLNAIKMIEFRPKDFIPKTGASIY